MVRSPVGARDLSRVQSFQTVSGVHPPYLMAIEESFRLKIKRPGREADHLHPCSEQIKEGMGLRFKYGPLCTGTFPEANFLTCLELTITRTAMTFFRNSTCRLKNYKIWNGQPQQTVK